MQGMWLRESMRMLMHPYRAGILENIKAAMVLIWCVVASSQHAVDGYKFMSLSLLNFLCTIDKSTFLMSSILHASSATIHKTAIFKTSSLHGPISIT